MPISEAPLASPSPSAGLSLPLSLSLFPSPVRNHPNYSRSARAHDNHPCLPPPTPLRPPTLGSSPRSRARPASYSCSSGRSSRGS